MVPFGSNITIETNKSEKISCKNTLNSKAKFLVSATSPKAYGELDLSQRLIQDINNYDIMDIITYLNLNLLTLVCLIQQ